MGFLLGNLVKLSAGVAGNGVVEKALTLWGSNIGLWA
jgi:hypothetical protein